MARMRGPFHSALCEVGAVELKPGAGGWQEKDLAGRVKRALELASKERKALAALAVRGKTGDAAAAAPGRAVSKMLSGATGRPGYMSAVVNFNNNRLDGVDAALKPFNASALSKMETDNVVLAWTRAAVVPPSAAQRRAKASRARDTAEVATGRAAVEAETHVVATQQPVAASAARDALAASSTHLGAPLPQSAETAEEIWKSVTTSIAAVNKYGSSADLPLLVLLETAATSLKASQAAVSESWAPTADTPVPTVPYLQLAAEERKTKSAASSRRSNAKKRVEPALCSIQNFSSASGIFAYDTNLNVLQFHVAELEDVTENTASVLWALVPASARGLNKTCTVEVWTLGTSPATRVFTHVSAAAQPLHPPAAVATTATTAASQLLRAPTVIATPATTATTQPLHPPTSLLPHQASVAAEEPTLWGIMASYLPAWFRSH